METLFDILAAIGVGAAAGLAPFVALSVVVLLAAVHVGVNPAGSDFNFVDDVVAVVVAAVVLAQSVLADLAGNTKFRIAADHRIHPVVHGLAAVAMGSLGGLVVFAASDQPRPLGAVLGALGALIVVWFGSEFFGRVAERVKRQSAAEAKQGKQPAGRGDSGAVALAVDLLTVAAVALAMIVPPAGLVLPALALVTALGRRRKRDDKYEGLRSLR